MSPYIRNECSAMVLLTLGERGRLGDLLDVAKDDIGLVIAVSNLPQRVRPKRSGKTKPSPRDEGRDGHEPAAF